MMMLMMIKWTDDGDDDNTHNDNDIYDTAMKILIKEWVIIIFFSNGMQVFTKNVDGRWKVAPKTTRCRVWDYTTQFSTFIFII